MEPTQGPYTVLKQNGTYVTAADGHTDICQVFGPNADANAALLAASWQLLQALEWAVDISPAVRDSDDVTFGGLTIDQIIAKAKGDAP